MRRLRMYGITNIYYEALDGTEVDVSGTKFSSNDDRLWGGISFGGSYNWKNDRYSIYGEGGMKVSLQHFADSHVGFGEVGFRMKF